MSFYPLGLLWLFQIIQKLFKYILHKIQPHLDNNEDQDGSEASF